MRERPKISVAIPTSPMKDGVNFFKRCLNSLWDQTLQNFEIIVTDNSEDSLIKDICDYYRTGIIYYRNPIKGMAQNTNAAIKHSRGELIKILYMDDFLIDNEALDLISKNFKGHWLVTACLHVDNLGIVGTLHIPTYNDKIQEGHNTIGSPSVLTIKNNQHFTEKNGQFSPQNPLLFDEEMTWLLDCDYYKRMHDLYGPPVILDQPLTAIGLHSDQATHTMGDERKLLEQEYMLKKYQNA